MAVVRFCVGGEGEREGEREDEREDEWEDEWRVRVMMRARVAVTVPPRHELELLARVMVTVTVIAPLACEGRRLP